MGFDACREIIDNVARVIVGKAQSVELLLVALLADGTRPAGYHSLTWRGTSDRGVLLPSGTYLVRLETRAGTITRKVMMLR